MPWQETRVEEQRMYLMAAVERQELTMAEACRRAGVSRKTGYKWLGRWRELGCDGLRNRSSAPAHHPNQTPPRLVETICAWRRANPDQGPVTLHWHLCRQYPRETWPAPSTIGELLRKAGLVEPPPPPPRARLQGAAWGLAHCTAPHAVLSIDFKGWFCVGDGERCQPFTVLDGFSRYLLACQAMPATELEVRTCLTAVFAEHGLPQVVRSDNGAPFAGTGLGRLSRLSVWFLKLGVRPEWIEPGKPWQNGRLERFHRTLKDQLAHVGVAANLAEQQAWFDTWRVTYNEDRPHRSLDMRTPAELYARSGRPWPAAPFEASYPAGYERRRVRGDGTIKWQGRFLYCGLPLTHELVGLEPLGHPENRYWQLWFGQHPLAILDSPRRHWLTAVEANRVLRARAAGPILELEQV